jgi:hypothetical protein
MIDSVSVIDLHGHVGRWDCDGMDDDPSLLLRVMASAGIDRTC